MTATAAELTFRSARDQHSIGSRSRIGCSRSIIYRAPSGKACGTELRRTEQDRGRTDGTDGMHPNMNQQLAIRQGTTNQGVVGSNPASRAKFSFLPQWLR